MAKADVGFFQIRYGDGTVENSMGRLLAFVAACVGSVIAVVGMLMKDAGIAGIGAGIFTTGELLKGWQKRNE